MEHEQNRQDGLPEGDLDDEHERETAVGDDPSRRSESVDTGTGSIKPIEHFLNPRYAIVWHPKDAEEAALIKAALLRSIDEGDENISELRLPDDPSCGSWDDVFTSAVEAERKASEPPPPLEPDWDSNQNPIRLTIKIGGTAFQLVITPIIPFKRGERKDIANAIQAFVKGEGPAPTRRADPPFEDWEAFRQHILETKRTKATPIPAQLPAPPEADPVPPAPITSRSGIAPADVDAPRAQDRSEPLATNEPAPAPPPGFGMPASPPVTAPPTANDATPKKDNEGAQPAPPPGFGPRPAPAAAAPAALLLPGEIRRPKNLGAPSLTAVYHPPSATGAADQASAGAQPAPPPGFGPLLPSQSATPPQTPGSNGDDDDDDDEDQDDDPDNVAAKPPQPQHAAAQAVPAALMLPPAPPPPPPVPVPAHVSAFLANPQGSCGKPAAPPADTCSKSGPVSADAATIAAAPPQHAAAPAPASKPRTRISRWNPRAMHETTLAGIMMGAGGVLILAATVYRTFFM